MIVTCVYSSVFKLIYWATDKEPNARVAYLMYKLIYGN